MTIRDATTADVPALIRMARAFLEATPYGRMFKATPESLEALLAFLFQLGDRGAILLAVDDDGQPFGMLVIVAAETPFDGRLYADEIVWWVDPTGRGQLRAGPLLLRAAEEWARERKCYMVKMVAPIPSTVGGFYERLGYSAIETAYAKVF